MQIVLETTSETTAPASRVSDAPPLDSNNLLSSLTDRQAEIHPHCHTLTLTDTHTGSRFHWLFQLQRARKAALGRKETMERPATLAAPATWAAPVLLVCRAMMVMAATKGPRAWQALLATRASLDCKVGEEGGGEDRALGALDSKC